MADKIPFTFTGVSFVLSKSGDTTVRCREEIVFEQIPSPRGICKFKQIKRTVTMPETEQLVCDKKMMKHAGDILSGDPSIQTRTASKRA